MIGLRLSLNDMHTSGIYIQCLMEDNVITKKYVETVASQQTNKPFAEFRINCPECEDTKFHMYCNLSKMVYICHKCGAKGKIVSNDAHPSLSAFREMYDRKNYYAPITIDPPKRTLPLCYPISTIIRHATPREVKAWAYLRNRGVTDEEINKYQISYTPDKDYIVFPCTTNVYWVSRNIKPTDKSPKYINAPWPKDDVLYNCYQTNKEYAEYFNGVIVEGIFDALAISRVGYRGIALLGKKANTKQLERLIDECTKGYLIFLDDDAFTYAVELQQQLRILANIDNKPNLQFRIMHVSGMDPAACALKDMDKLREELDEQNTQFKLGATKSTTVPKK